MLKLPRLHNAYSAATSPLLFVIPACKDRSLQTFKILLLNSCLDFLVMGTLWKPPKSRFILDTAATWVASPGQCSQLCLAGSSLFVTMERRQMLWAETAQLRSYIHLKQLLPVADTLSSNGCEPSKPQGVSPQRWGEGKPFLHLQIFRFSGLQFSI